MSYDALTITAIVIAVVIIAVIIFVGRSNANNERKMRALADHLIMLEGNEEAMKLCKQIHDEYPELCIGLDYTLREKKEGVEIGEWKSNHPKP
ncbi:MAG: hypothetical protein KJO91_11145 [Gammaproteobacteria bacterium]|nr:hypothetical protein [Gammaproteobacteria bacterium]